MAEPLSLGRLGRVLLRYWLLIVVGTLLGGALAFGVTRAMPPVYRATAIQLIKGLPGTGAAANYEAAQYAVSRAKTYPSFVYNLDVLEGVRRDLGNTESIVQLREDLSAANPVETPLLEISATGLTPTEAQDKANSAAKHMERFITEIETVGNKSPIIVETAVQAALPTKAASPKTLVIVALGALVGFVLATIFGLIHSYARFQRRAALRRKQALEMVGAEPALAVGARTGPVAAAPPVGQANSAGSGALADQTDAAPLADRSDTAPEVDPAKKVESSPKPGPDETWDLARQLAHAVTEATQSWAGWDESLFEIDPDPTMASPRIPMNSVAVDRVEPAGTAKLAGSTRSSDSTKSEESSDNDAGDTRDAANPSHAGEIEPLGGNGSADPPGSAEEITKNGLEKVKTLRQSAHR